MRAKVGEDRLIHTNWGYPYYGLINGNNLEGFPQANGDSYSAGWTQTVFGAHPGVGSYLDWLEKAREPNLTMVQTYEDDGAPDPGGNGSYRNPAAQPGFVPNYRKMRFGLTTALLGDGFFSYEVNTNGHGSLGLLWFDEYDNARRGRGYLGQPTGDARRVLPQLSTTNLVQNGGLHSSADLARWDLWTDNDTPAQAEVTFDATKPAGAGSARIEVTTAAPNWWQIEYSPSPARRSRRVRRTRFGSRHAPMRPARCLRPSSTTRHRGTRVSSSSRSRSGRRGGRMRYPPSAWEATRRRGSISD